MALLCFPLGHKHLGDTDLYDPEVKGVILD